MANSYYNHTSGVPAAQTRGISSSLRTEFDLVQTGFNLLPSLPQFYAGASNYAVDTGAANAYVIAVNAAIVSVATDGYQFNFRALAANTGASTLNTIAIVRNDGTALQANDILSGPVTVTYDSVKAKFVLNSSSATNATSAAVSATAAAASASAAAGSAVTAASQAASLAGTSTTSFLIGSGSKAFTTQASKQFSAGGWVTIASAANVTNYMFGQITAYNATSGALTINVTSIGGSGTFADWVVALSGVAGAAGPAASDGTIPIGGLVALAITTASLTTINGIDYLKTGVLAASASYTSAPLQNSFADGARVITTGNWVGVAYGPGIAVAISSNSATGQISYNNGDTWSPITLPNAGYNAVAFGNGLFVAVGASVCATSSDGLIWTTRTIAAQTWNSLIYNGTNFIALSSGTNVGTYSSTGITWSASTLPSTSNWGSLCFGGSLVLATLSSGASNVAASSADNGQTWTARTLPKSFTLEKQNCAYGAGLFAVLTIDPVFADTSCVFTSPDCVTWTSRNYNVIGNQLKTLTFAGGMFIGTRGGSVNCYTSPDGITWTTRTQSVTHAPGCTCVANGGRVIGLSSGSTQVDIYTMAYGRGYHIALFADSQNQNIPMYMRMN